MNMTTLRVDVMIEDNVTSLKAISNFSKLSRKLLRRTRFARALKKKEKGTPRVGERQSTRIKRRTMALRPYGYDDLGRQLDKVFG